MQISTVRPRLPRPRRPSRRPWTPGDSRCSRSCRRRPCRRCSCHRCSGSFFLNFHFMFFVRVDLKSWVWQVQIWHGRINRNSSINKEIMWRLICTASLILLWRRMTCKWNAHLKNSPAAAGGGGFGWNNSTRWSHSWKINLIPTTTSAAHFFLCCQRPKLAGSTKTPKVFASSPISHRMSATETSPSPPEKQQAFF